MAQWVSRERADGGVTVQIKWRMDGRWQTESFTDARLASEFRSAVEQAGHRWPQGWIRREGWAPAEPPASIVTFADVCDGENGYFARQEKRVRLGKIKAKTLHGYRRTCALHLEETFGSLDFLTIDLDDVSDWVDAQLEAGYSAKTIRDQHGLLSSMMKHGAQRMGLRGDNPCQVSDLPDLNHGTPQVRQRRFFQPEEWSLFRSGLKTDFRLPLDLDLATGMRWGKLSALRVGDIAFRATVSGLQANIEIVRAWSRRAPDDTTPIREAEGEDRCWILGPPKSKRSRWVAVIGDVAHELQRAVEGRAATDYVFVTREGRPWRYQHFYARRWTPAKIQAEKNGLTKKITPHMLRHTTVAPPPGCAGRPAATSDRSRCLQRPPSATRCRVPPAPTPAQLPASVFHQR